MQKTKLLALSNSLQNLLFHPGKYTSAQLLNVTPYFSSGSRFSLQKHRQLMKQIFDTEEQKIWWVVKAEYGEVDAKVMLLVLMLQLMSKERKILFNENASNVHKEGNLTSPRNRNTRALYISNEQTEIMSFVKEHLITFLRLLSNEPNSADPLLDSDDLQPLCFMFKVDRSRKFTSYLPIFNKSGKVKASMIAEHLAPRITISEMQMTSLEGISYSVTIKEEIHCREKDMRIIGCEDSEIFINSSVRSLYVVNCVNCTIYIAACEKIAFVDKCEKISFTVATNLLRICNTHDSNVYYYGPAPIILTGDNKSISIGPNNSPSDQIFSHLKNADIEVTPKNYNRFESILQKKYNNDEKTHNMMPPSNFDLLVLPAKEQQEKKKKKGSEIMAPNVYIAELEKRNKFYSGLKGKIAKGNLKQDMVKNLHSALQGNFREWLGNKGYTKNLNDLVKMLDRK